MTRARAAADDHFGLDPLTRFPEAHAVMSHAGRFIDLGTLGGPDSIGGLLNARGEAAGESFTNSAPNRSTGLPTMDSFLWQRGRMRDLGTLGGTFGMTNWMNRQGEVVGLQLPQGLEAAVAARRVRTLT